MRVVLDTNVLISAALKPNSWPASVLRWTFSHAVFLKSAETEQELVQVLARPRIAIRISSEMSDALERLFSAALSVPITKRIEACRDPKDDKFLELAVNGGADVIVSGDADLLTLHAFCGIPVLAPAAFRNAFVV